MLEHRLVLFTDISIEYLHAVKAIVFGCENFSSSVYKPIIKSGIYFVKKFKNSVKVQNSCFGLINFKR